MREKKKGAVEKRQTREGGKVYSAFEKKENEEGNVLLVWDRDYSTTG